MSDLNDDPERSAALAAQPQHRKQINVNVDAQAVVELDRMCKENHRSRSQQVSFLILQAAAVDEAVRRSRPPPPETFPAT